MTRTGLSERVALKEDLKGGGWALYRNRGRTFQAETGALRRLCQEGSAGQGRECGASARIQGTEEAGWTGWRHWESGLTWKVDPTK